MKTFSVLLLFCRVSSTVGHSVEFFITASHGLPDFPEFVAAAVVDGVEFATCDSKTKILKFHEWTREFTDNYPEYWSSYSVVCLIHQNVFSSVTVDVMKVFNQSEGVHILQSVSGCEWDEETGETGSFCRVGYDGKDLVSFNPQTLTWTVLNPEALTSKFRGQSDKGNLQYLNTFFNQYCPFWLKQTVANGRKYLQQKVLPSISLLQKSPSSPVSCFASGFYPDRAVMFWRKDGEELHEGVDHREILPNNDDTFQMSVDLNISSVKLEDWEKYECVFQLSGVMEDIVTRLDKSVIPYVPGSPPWVPVVSGVVPGLLLLSVSIAGFIMWRKKKNGEQNNPEMVLDSSL
ncbi:major histocompatibility complex class I-related gene protein-like [Cheilinus undulatus]|uniref:major histocompatibility complex class I-related gene protein-like n=1 Tax=Cheilinus undulatus TaxID=241271 RepID=UPI001BD4A3B5|nr:major histocompatibility complex class I-related gene protein-like [Cheilinus undulatus]